MDSLKNMNAMEIKDKIQEALDAYKKQFEEDLSTEKKEAFSKLFNVSVDEYKYIYIDKIKVGFGTEEPLKYICYEIDPEFINIFINGDEVLRINFRYEYEQPLPSIKEVYIARKIYSDEEAE